MGNSIPLVALGFALALPAATGAADLPRQGNYDVTACFTRTVNRIALGKSSAASLEQFGVSMSNPPGGIFDGESVHCVGMTASLPGGKPIVSNVCESVDRDGDRRFTRFHTDANGEVVRQHIEGTGKFDGLETTGNYTSANFPAIKDGVALFCNRQTGTYKLR